MARDPWDEFALVDETAHPPQQGMETTPQASAPEAGDAPAIDGEWDEFAPADPVLPDGANMVDATQTIGGFANELPPEIASKLKPEQIAQWESALKPGATAQQLSDTMRSFGFDLSNAEEVAASLAAGTPINRNFKYGLPDVDTGDDSVGSFARGVGDTVTMGTSNKLAAAAQAVNDVFSGKGEWGDRYDANLDYQNAIEGRDGQEHPYARIAGQLVGGMALPTGLQTVGARAGALAMREARAAGSNFDEAMLIGREAAARAVRGRMTKEGAAYGAAYGAGSADTVEDAATGAATGLTVGAVGGDLLGRAGAAVAPRLVERAAAGRAKPLSDGQQVMAAADRLGQRFDDLEINPLPADVGGPVTRRATSATAQAITGAQPIIAGGQRVAEQGKAMRDRIAEMIGQAFLPEAAGNEGRIGAQKYIANSAAEARKFYGPAEAKTKGFTVSAPKAVANLDEHIAELGETPGGAPGLATLEGLRESLAKGDATVAGIRRMRTVLRDQFIKDGLTGSDLERRVTQVINAAAEDVSDGLKAAGMPDAAANFRKGDAAWRQRSYTIDTAIKPLIGTRDKPKSGEQIIKTLTADLQSNNARAVKFIRALPDKEQSNVRASIIGALGKAPDGKQGAAGEAFSLPTFLTNWNQIGDRAKAVYFGPEARAALNDLASVAEGSKEAQKYANHSNTAGGIFGNLIMTGGAGVAGAKTLGATLILPFLSGTMLASPRFARWLARAPRTSLGQRAHVDRLGRIARAEPAIAQDVLSLQSRLLEAFEPARLAADDRTDK